MMVLTKRPMFTRDRPVVFASASEACGRAALTPALSAPKRFEKSMLPRSRPVGGALDFRNPSRPSSFQKMPSPSRHSRAERHGRENGKAVHILYMARECVQHIDNTAIKPSLIKA